MNFHEQEKQRIDLTTSCKDSDYIPKVSSAGSVTISTTGQRVQTMHNGCIVLADSYYGSFQTEIIQKLRGHHEPQEEKIFYEVLKYIKPGSVMLELGSYWSYYSLWFQTEIKNSKSYMLEPSLSGLEIGKKNFDLNKKEGTFIHAFAGKFNDTTTTPETITVDKIMDRYQLDHLDILHADIQGHEYDMLLGSQNALYNKKVKFVLISTHGLMVHYKCLKFLQKNGLNILASHTPAESYSVDGLIAGSIDKYPYIEISISRRNVDFETSLKSLISSFFSNFIV